MHLQAYSPFQSTALTPSRDQFSILGDSPNHPQIQSDQYISGNGQAQFNSMASDSRTLRSMANSIPSAKKSASLRDRASLAGACGLVSSMLAGLGSTGSTLLTVPLPLLAVAGAVLTVVAAGTIKGPNENSKQIFSKTGATVGAYVTATIAAGCLLGGLGMLGAAAVGATVGALFLEHS